MPQLDKSIRRTILVKELWDTPMNAFFTQWDSTTRTVIVVRTNEVEVSCLPENDTVSIWNKRDQSCVVITVATWNSFARDEHRLPTHAEWQQFWGNRP